MTLVATLVAAALVASPPTEIAVQGRLGAASGAAVDGTYSLTIALWSAQSGGLELWKQTLPDVAVVDGVFSAELKGVPATVWAGDPPWVAVATGNEPALPRQPTRSVPYALFASQAQALACTGCVGPSALSPEVNQLIEAAAQAGYTDEEAVQAVVDSGLFYAKGGSAILADMLPADGLDEVSGNMISNTFKDVFASTDTPKAIADQNPLGSSSTITVPNVGIAQSFEVNVVVSGHSDISELTVTVYSPAGEAFVLLSKDAAKKGTTGFNLTWPKPVATVSGDLTKFVGTNIQGAWYIKVVDSVFDNNETDGTIQSWSLAITTLSNQKLQIAGDLWANGHQIKALGAPTAATDATNKAYVDASFKDRVFTGTYLAVGAGQQVTLTHNAGKSQVFAQAWFKDPSTGLWSQSGASVAGEELGDASEGAFKPTSNTNLAGGTHNYSVVDIPANVTVTVTGSSPLVIRSQGPVSIAGTLTLAGGDGHTVTALEDSAGGTAGGGGGQAGGSCAYLGTGNAGGGPGAGAGGGYSSYGGGGGGAGHALAGKAGGVGNTTSNGTPGAGGSPITSLEASTLVGGSGGGAGGGGGAANAAGGGGGGGGGAVKIVAPSITVSGKITAAGGAGGGQINARDGGGGGGGAGGCVWLVSGSVLLSGTVTAKGGAGGIAEKDSTYGGDGGAGSDGRIRIDAFSVQGTTTPAAIGGTTSVGITASPLRIYQPDGNSVRVQNLSFIPLDVQALVIVP